MSGCFRPPIAISGRTGRRIGQTARRYNHAVCLYPFPIGKLQTDCLPVLFQNPLHAAVQMDLHALSLQQALQRADHVRRMVGYREHAVAAFRFQWTPRLLQKLHHRLIIKRFKRAV